MTRPDFFVVGAGRAGTTTLHHWLDAHPEVFVTAEKSPNHFAAEEVVPAWETPVGRAMAARWVRDPVAYESLFDGAGDALAVGEVSPVYLQAVGVPGRIHEACPAGRVVAILRDPAERAWSHFLGRRRDGIEPEASFARRVDQELAAPLPDEVAFGHYVGCGRYHHFLRPYLDRFGPDRCRLYLYEDLVDDADGLATDLYDFLGVDPSFGAPTEVRLNRTGEIRSPLKRAVWTRTAGVRTRLRPLLPAAVRDRAGARFLAEVEHPPLGRDLRARIVDALRDDILALQALLDRDLSSWLAA